MRIGGAIGGVLLGLTMSQVPEFTQQYAQRLGGAVDELRAITQNFDASAQKVGLTRAQALATYDQAQNGFLADQGRDMSESFIRFAKLELHLMALQSAGPVSRVVDLARYYDPQIGARALEAYAPAVPVTTDGFAYAGVGTLAGYFSFAGIIALLSRLFRSKRNRGVSLPPS
jgi:hypothetical protein